MHHALAKADAILVGRQAGRQAGGRVDTRTRGEADKRQQSAWTARQQSAAWTVRQQSPADVSACKGNRNRDSMVVSTEIIVRSTAIADILIVKSGVELSKVVAVNLQKSRPSPKATPPKRGADTPIEQQVRRLHMLWAARPDHRGSLCAPTDRILACAVRHRCRNLL